MPSRRSRSGSLSRERPRSPKRRADLPHNASSISESDYFQKSNEFRIWLKDEKGEYFDELPGDRARSYFRKFVKAWNRGKISRSLYAGVDPSSIPATSQTAYKWSFSSKTSSAEADQLRRARELVGAATYGLEPASQVGSSSQNSGRRVLGPTLPSGSDAVLAREAEAEAEREQRNYKRKRDKLEAKERIEDMVGPREVGKEGMLEKKRARREADKSFRDKGDDGLEADESTLLGGGDSFKQQIARRDAARKRYEQKSQEKIMATQERASQMREREKATMDMFQQMAKRFG